MNRLVTYDLRNQRNYEMIHKAISDLGVRHEQQLESVWLVESSQSAQALLDTLRSAIDEDDGLLVAEVTNHAGVGLKPQGIATELLQALKNRNP